MIRRLWFNTRYAKLNDNQRQTVDTFTDRFGIAGRGTGKPSFWYAHCLNRDRPTLCQAAFMLDVYQAAPAPAAARLSVRTHIKLRFAFQLRCRNHQSTSLDIFPPTLSQSRVTQYQIISPKKHTWEDLDWRNPLAQKHVNFDTIKNIRSISSSSRAVQHASELQTGIEDNQAQSPKLRQTFSKYFHKKYQKRQLSYLHRWPKKSLIQS